MSQIENFPNHFPAGDYEVEVENLYIGRAETGNASSPLAFDWQCRVLTGAFANEVTHHRIEATDENIRFIKDDLRLVGIENASLDELRLVQENVFGINCLLRLETTNDQSRSRIRFISRLKDEVNLSANLEKASEEARMAKQLVF